MPLFGRVGRVIDHAADASELVRLAATAASPPSPAVAAEPLVIERLIEQIIRSRGTRVTRTVAMSVPAFARGLSLITGSIAALPLREYADDTAQAPRRLLVQPDPMTAAHVTMRALADDLVCYGHGYWQVIEVTGDGPYTYPTAVKPIPACEVTPDADPRWLAHDGRRLRVSDPTSPGSVRGDVIVFRGWDGVLAFAGTSLALAASLEATVATYAATPIPQTALKNTGADLDAKGIDALLDAWEESRSNRVTAYLSAAIEVEKLSWNAADLQLIEARNQAALEVARALNLDPVWVGAGVAGSSVTYQNRVDLYRQLVDNTLTAILRPIEQRLSMWDVTPRGREVRFDLSAFLRSNAEQRADLVAKLLPLGVMTVDEARDLMDYGPSRESTR